MPNILLINLSHLGIFDGVAYNVLRAVYGESHHREGEMFVLNHIVPGKVYLVFLMLHNIFLDVLLAVTCECYVVDF